MKLKTQNPVTSSATQRRQAGDGIFFGKQNSHCGLNAFSRAFNKLQQRSGRSPDFASPLNGEVIHSGATVRDSHPLPYSPRFYAGHPKRMSKIGMTLLGGQYHLLSAGVKPEGDEVSAGNSTSR